MKGDYSRDAQMCEMFSSGMSLQEIARVYSLSRERVRQLINRNGLTGVDGGRAVKARGKPPKPDLLTPHRNRRAMGAYGCDFNTALEANEGKRFMDKSSKAWKYIQHKRNSGSRRIGWEFDFPLWCKVWGDKISNIGTGRDCYVMCRKGDCGPYAPDNVYIATSQENVRDGLVARGIIQP